MDFMGIVTTTYNDNGIQLESQRTMCGMDGVENHGESQLSVAYTLYSAMTIVACRHSCPKDNLESGESGGLFAFNSSSRYIDLTYLYIGK